MSSIKASLSRAVDDFYSLLDQGEPRHAAAVKVASSHSLMPDQIDRMCQTLNRAAVDTNRRGADSLGDRLTNPGVLDPSSVRQGVFQRKNAGHSNILSQLSAVIDGMEQVEANARAEVAKTAAAIVEEPVPMRDSHIHGLYARLGPVEVQTTKLALINDINQRHHSVVDAERRSIIAVNACCDQMRKNRGKHILVKQAAYYAGVHETDLAPVVDYLAHQLGINVSTKTASAPASWHKELLSPGGTIDQIRQCANSLKLASAAMLEHFPQIIKSKMRLSLLINTAAGNVPKTALFAEGSYAEHQEQEIQKVADIATSFMGSMLGSQRPQTPKPGLAQDPAVQNFTLQLRNPQHESELRAIRSRAAIQSLLAGDEVLKAYEPNKVIDAFNELNQHTPAAAENKAMLRATLRQMLQNNISVYDLQQFRALERKPQG